MKIWKVKDDRPPRQKVDYSTAGRKHQLRQTEQCTEHLASMRKRNPRKQTQLTEWTLTKDPALTLVRKMMLQSDRIVAQTDLEEMIPCKIMVTTNLQVVKLTTKMNNIKLLQYLLTFHPTRRIIQPSLTSLKTVRQYMTMGNYITVLKRTICKTLKNLNGSRSTGCQWAGKVWSTANKLKNNLQRALNGNIYNIKKNIKVTHWYAGPSHWINKKHTIEEMIFDFRPDIAIISEANIFYRK